MRISEETAGADATVGIGVGVGTVVDVVVVAVGVGAGEGLGLELPPPPPPPPPPLPPPPLQNEDDGVTVTDVVAAVLGAAIAIVCWPALHEFVVTHAEAASCESEGAAIVMLDAGPNKTMKLLVPTVVEATVAPPAMVTVTPPIERLDVLAASVTSLKFVAAVAASGNSNAAMETDAEAKNFFMRVR